jgi:Alpha-2,8-polysialyltransferase (POLYST)
VLSFRRHCGTDAKAPLTVLVWSHPATEHKTRERRLQAFKLLLGGFPWATLFFPEQNEVKAHLSHNSRVMRKADYLRGKFGPSAFAAVYYAHDVSADFIAQSAMQAYPNASRVCFGDALGVVYSNDYFTDHTYPVGAFEAFSRPIQTIRNLLFRTKRSWTLPTRRSRLDASHAALVLPCDPGGDFLAGKKLQTVDYESLNGVLDCLSRSAERHLIKQTYWDEGAANSSVVMLLGSYSESRLTSETKECALYVEAAHIHILPGSTIILKAHPASQPEKIALIEHALSAHYDTVVVSNDEIPIETMPSLAKHYKILSFSYSSVSLLYLYGSTVLHAMNDTLINMFFPEETRLWMRESNALYLQQIDIARRLSGKQSEALVCQK